ADARCLYLAILLSADDTARCDGSPFALSRRVAATMSKAEISGYLVELSTADLIRPYQDGRYIFVPRFRQRMRYPNSKYPEPPKVIMELDDRKTDSSQTHASPKSYPSQSLVRPETHEVKRSEVKRSEERGDVDVRPRLEKKSDSSQQPILQNPLPPKTAQPQIEDEPSVDQIERREAEKRRQLDAIRRKAQETLDATT